jgi:hypothetical protein
MCDIPNAFVQTKLSDTDKDGDFTIMKIRGALVDILCEMDPVYEGFVRTDRHPPQKSSTADLSDSPVLSWIGQKTSCSVTLFKASLLGRRIVTLDVL